jgi:hypothetical protein
MSVTAFYHLVNGYTGFRRAQDAKSRVRMAVEARVAAANLSAFSPEPQLAVNQCNHDVRYMLMPVKQKINGDNRAGQRDHGHRF